MSRRVVAAVAAAVLVPAAGAHAQAPAPTGGAEAAPEPEVVSASSGPISVSTTAAALKGRTLRLRGAVPATEQGRTVTVERMDEIAGTWAPVAYAPIAEGGAFVARWKPDRVGPVQVRARIEAPEAAAAATAPQVGLTVFRAARATWYGPGLYGRRTACGTRLRRTTFGVAHRTLPCGTKVTVLYDGRTITVPVIDRGPFTRHAKWDLTAATAYAVGMTATSTIGTLRAERRAPAG